MAWQVGIVLDPNTRLQDLQVLLGQMPVWALDTPERKEALLQLNEESGALWSPDPTFTVFAGFFPSDPVAEVLNVLLTVEEHHPGMRAARLLGVEQSERLKAELGELGYLPLRGSTYPGSATPDR